MRSGRLTTLIAAVCLLTAARAYSQTDLTWDQCIKEAEDNNRDLKVAEQTVKASDDTHIASLGQWLPQISLGTTLSRTGPDSSVGGALSDPNYVPGATLGISAQETIFSGFKDFASVDLANAQLDIARAQLTQAKAQLSHDLKTDFYQLLYNQKQIKLLMSIRDRDKANVDLVQMNFSGGTDNKGSLLIAQAAVEQDDYNIDQAKRNLRVTQRQLDQVLGRNPMEDISVDGDFDVPELPGNLPNFMELTNETPAHLQAVAQYHSADSSYVSARGAFFPTLTANAGLSGSGASYDTMAAGWNATLSLTFPLFTGGHDLFTLKSAEESKQGAEDTLESTDLKTENQLEGAYAAYLNAVEQDKVQQFQVKAAQTQEEIAKAEYLNGLLIFQNWNQIESNLTNQQNGELSGLLSIKTAEANWELTEGKGVIP
ncbi:MAG TPA: TolC family protein [bacterium]|jgi:outer membrane protein TolC|nr:TolC family protein [bacterium]